MNPRLTSSFASDSLEYLPLADATTLNLLAPLGASFVTTKRFSPIQAGSIAVCFLGVGIIAKPHFVVDLFNNQVGDVHHKMGTLQPQLGFTFAMIGALGGVVRNLFQFLFRPSLTLRVLLLCNFQDRDTIPSTCDNELLCHWYTAHKQHLLYCCSRSQF